MCACTDTLTQNIRHHAHPPARMHYQLRWHPTPQEASPKQGVQQQRQWPAEASLLWRVHRCLAACWRRLLPAQWPAKERMCVCVYVCVCVYILVCLHTCALECALFMNMTPNTSLGNVASHALHFSRQSKQTGSLSDVKKTSIDCKYLTLQV